MDEKKVKESIQVDRIWGAKPLLGSLFQATWEHDALVAVSLLHSNLEAVRDRDGEEHVHPMVYNIKELLLKTV